MGQPSSGLIVLFKMMLLGYLYGVTSERLLAKGCAPHLAFRSPWEHLGRAIREHSLGRSISPRSELGPSK